MEQYPPNYHGYKEESEKKDKKVEKVVTGAVRTRKKSELRKLGDIFLADDITNVKSYILNDILIPAIKDGIEDVVHLLLRGESGRGRKSTPGSKVSYRAYYDRERDRREPPRQRGGYDFDEVVIGSRGEAEDVLSRMDDLIDMYKVVSVADFYDLVGMSCDYTANKYGWSNIRNAQVVRVRDGWVIKLPRPVPVE